MIIPEKFQNFLLRAISSGIKFFGVVALAKLIPIELFSDYVLFTTFINIFVLVIGFDFYTYIHRDIIQDNKKNIVDKLLHHLAFIIIVYLVVFVPLLLFLSYSQLGSRYYLLFFLVLIFEHMSQEVCRFFTCIEKQIKSSIVLIIRTVPQFLLFFILITLFDIDYPLLSFLVLWFAFSLASVILGLYWICSEINISLEYIKNFRLDKRYIIKGLKISAVFFTSTIFSKLMFGGDRVLLSLITESPNNLAVYGFFSMLCFGLYAFLEPLVYSYSYQKLIQNARVKNKVLWLENLKKMSVEVLLFTALFTSFVYFFSGFFLEWIGKTEYIDSNQYFYIFNASAALLALSMVSHFGLYSLRRDKDILLSQIVSTIIFFICTYILSYYFLPLLAVSYALLFSYLVLFLSKSGLLLFRYNKILSDIGNIK